MNINKEKKFAVIGCGRMGTAIAVYLSGLGFVARAFSSKSLASAEKARDFVGSGMVFADPADAVKKAELIFITTPDGVIESVCKDLSELNCFSRNHVIFHLSGALSSEILSSARKSGASVGSIHPLQAFAPYEEEQQSPFRDINISIEGDDTAVTLGKSVVEALGAIPFIIPTDAKTLYHAAAVVASNYLVTLEHFAFKLLEHAGLPEPEACRILGPLVNGTLQNIKNNGSIKALTGPISRGDDIVVSRHLQAIEEKSPHFSDLYRKLGNYTLDIANQNPDRDRLLSDKARLALEKLFEPKAR